MHVLFYLVVACLAAVSYGSPTPHIVGGDVAKIGEFPYIISMRWIGGHWCGGSIIDRRHILMAAHCLVPFKNMDLSYLTVHAGTNFVNVTGDVYNVDALIIHSKYDSKLIRNDIGLLRLTKDIQFKSTVKPIALPATRVAKTGDPCTISGWGDLQWRGEHPYNLRKLNTHVFSQTTCNEITKGNGGITDGQICTFKEMGQGFCNGDSGGPLVSKGVQIGIVSYVLLQCAAGYPDVFTRVSFYHDWIQKHTKL